MPKNQIDVVVICGSLREGSYNAMVAQSLPELAPDDMVIRFAPSFEEFPFYNADIQNSSGFPSEVTDFADAIRDADGIVVVTPEYNFSIPGGLKNALDWVSRLHAQPFANKPVAIQSATWRPRSMRRPANSPTIRRRNFCASSSRRSQNSSVKSARGRPRRCTGRAPE